MEYQRTKVNFAEVKYFARKMGICTVCGKYASREKRFTQTINPWNKTKDGHVKDRTDIYRDLQQEAEQWKCLPVFHKKCE